MLIKKPEKQFIYKFARISQQNSILKSADTMSGLGPKPQKISCYQKFQPKHVVSCKKWREVKRNNQNNFTM